MALRRLAVLVVAGAALAAGGPAAAGAAPQLFRPNPVLATTQVDYGAPLESKDGKPLTLAALNPAITSVAVSDQRYLNASTRVAMSGFGATASAQAGIRLASDARNLIGGTGAPQIPTYQRAAGGTVQSFAAVGGTSTSPPDNGRQPVPGLGVPSSNPSPTSTNTVPPPNQGFGGSPAGTGGGTESQPPPGTTTTGAATTTTVPTTTVAPPGTTTPTTTTRPPTTTTTRPPTTTTTTTTATTTTTTTTTTAPTTTTARTTTTPTTTTSGGGGGIPPGNTNGSGSCGSPGLSVTSSLPSCRIVAVNMAPGGSATETMRIENTSSSAYELTVQVAGTPSAFWNDLRLAIWPDGTAAPDPLPPLMWWTGQQNQLGTLQPGQVVTYDVQLYLPTSAGNAAQQQSAVFDLVWHAQA